MSIVVGKTKISVVGYVNSAPLAWGVLEGEQREKFDPIFSMPAECADQLSSGSVDVGLIPSIEYQQISGTRIIPGAAVASLSRVRSVILVSTLPLWRIRTVSHDSASRASVALAKIVLQKTYGTRAEFRPAEPNVERMLADSDAALLIGDIALRYRAANMLPNAEEQKGLIREGAEPLQVFDLMERWQNLTGLPFVFAFWAARPSFRDKAVIEELISSRDYGLKNLEAIAGRYAEKIQLDKSYILQYLEKNMYYHMNADCVESLRVFYELAAETEIIKSARVIRFL